MLKVVRTADHTTDVRMKRKVRGKEDAVRNETEEEDDGDDDDEIL